MKAADKWLADAAKKAGVSTRTVRRWEECGVLPFVVRRSALGWRQFSVDEIDQLRQFAILRATTRKRPNSGRDQ